MEIPIRSQFDSRHYAFILTYDTQNIAGIYDGDTRRLNINAMLRRDIHPKEDVQQRLEMTILDLHGRLYPMNASHENGALLQPCLDLPIHVIPGALQNINLSFLLSTHYLQHLEEYRASLPRQGMTLQIELWGVAAMMIPRPGVQGIPDYLQSRSGEVIRFERISTEPNGHTLRIERSAWIDQILPGMGYQQNVLIELPLVHTHPLSERYQGAVESLENSRKAFSNEDYKGALRNARDVLEYLGKSSSGGNGQISNFCKEVLEPAVGATRSHAIDVSLNGIRNIVNASSHVEPQNTFVPDRDIAAYTIETLALNLRYIASVLKR